MFNLKKFISLIGIDNRLMQLFFDKAEAAGLNPNFDIYHILSDDEMPSDAEIGIMKEIFEFNVKGTEYEQKYLTADTDFIIKIAEKNKQRISPQKDNRHYNN